MTTDPFWDGTEFEAINPMANNIRIFFWNDVWSFAERHNTPLSWTDGIDFPVFELEVL